MKYHAFLGNDEKEFKASSWERLREFIEVYWLNYNLSEETWKRLLRGEAVHFITVGTIHLEED